MRAIPSTFTVAQYCGQMQEKSIVVNRDYQRSDQIWPPAARSYLIDSILLGYPIPKLSLYQKTDLKSRKTIYEIVDGQQRSMAILAFFENKLRFTGKTDFHGQRYEDLDPEQQQEFLAYPLTVDIFADADEETIRQVFRRINSYNVPLNPQERRHADYQGCAKWFIVDLCDRYSGLLKRFGVFSEAQLSRMNDAKLFTEIGDAVLNGLSHASEPRLDNFYRENDGAFPKEKELARRFRSTFDMLLEWEPLHGTALMKAYNFYTLFLAITHSRKPAAALIDVYDVQPRNAFDDDIVLPNLTLLAEVLEKTEARVLKQNPGLIEFYRACSKATNRLGPRTVRLQTLCRALEPELLK